MTADILADWSNATLVHHNGAADALRGVIAVMAILTCALLTRLYLTDRTGRMNRQAGIGATSTYFVIAWAQIAALVGPSDELTALNVGVFAAVAMSLLGTLRAMDVRLFRR